MMLFVLSPQIVGKMHIFLMPTVFILSFIESADFSIKIILHLLSSLSCVVDSVHIWHWQQSVSGNTVYMT